MTRRSRRALRAASVALCAAAACTPAAQALTFDDVETAGPDASGVPVSANLGVGGDGSVALVTGSISATKVYYRAPGGDFEAPLTVPSPLPGQTGTAAVDRDGNALVVTSS